MAGAARIGDISSGHDSCPPSALIAGSTNVMINGIGAGRQGDGFAPHACILHGTHSDSIAGGSTSVYINGLPAARIGDLVSMAGSIAVGSANVNIGG